MNPALESDISAASERLLQQIALYGHGDKARAAQARLDELRRQRTPQDHAELAQRLGLPVGGAA